MRSSQPHESIEIWLETGSKPVRTITKTALSERGFEPFFMCLWLRSVLSVGPWWVVGGPLVLKG